ncbi:MAG: hypothetical protein HQL12_04395 [Candidatus Omnitrophica bacterium]|nr:hypothetical protein [Candidatus Omnitrophota bacterium]
MIKVYTGIKGLAIFLVCMAGIILCVSVFFWGITKVIQLFLPLLIVASYLLIIIFVLGVLPSTSIKNMRPLLGVYSFWMSHALGISTWVMSFFFVVNTVGLVGVFFGLLFEFLAPIAIVMAVLKGAGHIAGHLTLWICFTYAMRVYSQWLLNVNPLDQGKNRIIDVDAVEVQGP